MLTTLLLSAFLSASIEGPTAFAPYTLGRFKADIEPDAAVSWLVLSGTDTADFDAHDCCMVFTGKPGRYLVIMSTFGTDKDGKPFLQQVTKSVDITNGPPPGPDPPNPPDPPGPTPLPDGKFKLAAWAFQSVQAMPAEDKAKAKDLGDAFDALASQLDAGTFPRNDGMKAFLQATQEKVKSQGGTWPQWLVTLKTQIASLPINAGKDCADAWREIATGLRAVK